MPGLSLSSAGHGVVHLIGPGDAARSAVDSLHQRYLWSGSSHAMEVTCSALEEAFRGPMSLSGGSLSTSTPGSQSTSSFSSGLMHASRGSSSHNSSGYSSNGSGHGSYGCGTSQWYEPLGGAAAQVGAMYAQQGLQGGMMGGNLGLMRGVQQMQGAPGMFPGMPGAGAAGGVVAAPGAMGGNYQWVGALPQQQQQWMMMPGGWGGVNQGVAQGLAGMPGMQQQGQGMMLSGQQQQQQWAYMSNQQQQQVLAATNFHHHQQQQQLRGGVGSLPMGSTAAQQQNSLSACTPAAVGSSWQMSSPSVGIAQSQAQPLQGIGSPQPQSQQQQYLGLEGAYAQNAGVLASGALQMEPLGLQHSGGLEGTGVDSLMQQLHLN